MPVPAASSGGRLSAKADRRAGRQANSSRAVSPSTPLVLLLGRLQAVASRTCSAEPAQDCDRLGKSGSIIIVTIKERSRARASLAHTDRTSLSTCQNNSQRKETQGPQPPSERRRTGKRNISIFPGICVSPLSAADDPHLTPPTPLPTTPHYPPHPSPPHPTLQHITSYPTPSHGIAQSHRAEFLIGSHHITFSVCSSLSAPVNPLLSPKPCGLQ